MPFNWDAEGCPSSNNNSDKNEQKNNNNTVQRERFVWKEIPLDIFPVNVCIKQVNKYENNYKRVAWQLDFLYVCECDR